MTEQERYERIMETRKLLKNLYDAGVRKIIPHSDTVCQD